MKMGSSDTMIRRCASRICPKEAGWVLLTAGVVGLGVPGVVGTHRREPMSGMGHQERFSPQRLSASFGPRKETIAAMRRNARCAESGPSCRHSRTGRFDLKQSHRREVIRGNPYSI